MSTGWENHEAAPIEFMHGKMMDLFYELRLSKTKSTTFEIDATEINNIIAKAKTETYAKYPKQVSSKAILKTEL